LMAFEWPNLWHNANQKINKIYWDVSKTHQINFWVTFEFWRTYVWMNYFHGYSIFSSFLFLEGLHLHQLPPLLGATTSFLYVCIIEGISYKT
jgi:hypothetical protein